MVHYARARVWFLRRFKEAVQGSVEREVRSNSPIPGQVHDAIEGPAVHGRNDEDRPWMDKVNCISKSPRHKATRIRMISREAFRLWPV